MKGVLKIECPDCGSTLHVDAESGAIIDHQPRSRPKVDLDLGEAARQLKEREAQRHELFQKSVAAQKRREELLREKFEEGLRRARNEPAPDKPLRDFDLD